MPDQRNGVLEKMLDRLFAALVNGPSLNCRPHASRQRIDLIQIGKLKDNTAEQLLRDLLGENRSARAAAKVAPPKRRKRAESPEKSNGNGQSGEDLSPEEKAAIAAWDDQEQVFRKLRVIVDDARIYEQDTGVHVLNIGFPLLRLPLDSFRSSRRGLGRRIIAPVAFIPVSLSVKQGTTRSIELKCRGEGADLVVPNIALLAWLQQQSGQELIETFADDKGDAPWKEIRELVEMVAKAAGVAPPQFLALPENAPDDAPPDLPLIASPAADDGSDGAIIPSAVLGLFPMANQGLLRDTQEMLAAEKLDGPVANFLRHDAILDAPAPAPAGQEPAPVPRRTRSFSRERLVAAADPSQSKAVRLARDCQGLVIHGPPGTGKSQTITNIIGDHLSRGQRVLVVCDKRTALDVVIDRLDRLGLRKLCALVYDPQRDRRELYKAIRQQLDDLPDQKTDSRAQREIERLDAELQRLHDELTQYCAALSTRDPRTGMSFHELAGRWMEASSHEIPALDAKLLSSITVKTFHDHEQSLCDIFDRAAECDYPNNPWKNAWGISLFDFLSQPMTQVREAIERCRISAMKADATAHPAIPNFDPETPLHEQANARRVLAAELRDVLGHAPPVLQAIATKATPGGGSLKVPTDGEILRRLLEAKKQIDDCAPSLALLRIGPLDAELLSIAGEKLTAPDVAESHRIANAFLDAYRRWSARYRFVSTAVPKAWAKVIAFWLAKSADAVGRAKARCADLSQIAQTISAGRMDRSMWLQYQRQPFDLAQTVRWLGEINSYLDVAGKWYAFLRPGPKKKAAPIAQYFGFALTPQTGAQIRDFLVALRARLELKADLEDGLLAEPLEQFPSDEDLLAAYTCASSVIEAVANGQSAAAGNPLAPEIIAPIMPAETSAARDLFSKYHVAMDESAAQRLVKFLAGLQARLICDDVLAGLGVAKSSSFPEDEFIERSLVAAGKTTDFLIGVYQNPPLKCIRMHVVDVLCDPSKAPSFLEGLDRSPDRANSIVGFLTTLEETKLIRSTWIAAADRRLRGGSLEASLIQNLEDRLDLLETVLRVAKGIELLPAELRGATEALANASATTKTALAALGRSAFATEITGRLAADPNLHVIDRQRMKSSFERYRSLDAKKREAVRDDTLHQWITRQQARLLANTGSRLNTLGAELRRRLTITGERAMRLRQVIALGRPIEGGDPLFDLCPVWMVSPETVAQLFPREPIFDVVVFDEASQCRLEEGLPVLTRAKRVVVAGDPQQLPPTRFFESAIAESEDEEIETEQQLFEARQGEVEDLLGAALNLQIEQSYLDVHYRSRNSDLIEFSNEHFYSSRLQPIPGHPSRRARVAPITLYRADGIYKKRTNEQEAEEVCKIVGELLKRAEPPSIGIACFNLPQRDLIVEKLEEMASEDSAFAKRLAAARLRQGSGSSEALFVKNLENVQGDERDHIIISTTYGPDPNGRFYRRFGPVGRPGGGRRLNVLITRARHEIHLVTSIPAEAYRTLPEIPAGQSPSGAWLLFAYLAYAQRLAEQYETARQLLESADATPAAQVNVRPSRSPSEFSPPFARHMADDRKIGSDVHWGNDGFCIDLALHHPARADDVTIGVLCDGSRFSLAEDPVEWDVFRTGVLEEQGWTLHRLWTPHVFRDPDGNMRSIEREVRSFLAAEEDDKVTR